MKTTKKSSTKKSLVLSTLSLVLCIAMLLGTTYAWFTDSVTSGKNKIVAGNLDVELYHTNKAVTKEKVTETTQLFKDVTLWEPGAVAYETLTVANVGTLALNYQMSILVDNEVKEAGRGLSEILKVGTISGGLGSGATRESIIDQISVWSSLASFTKNGSLDAETEDTPVTYVIYWKPGDNDNLYNMNNENKGKELSIDLGVKLVAGQKAQEVDSFDEKYDLSAFTVITPETFDSVIANLKGGENLYLGAGTYAPSARETLKILVNDVTIVGAGKDVTVIDCGTMDVSDQAGLYIAGDNITIANLTVKSSYSATGNLSPIKVTGYMAEDTGKVYKNFKLENVALEGLKGHGLNLHGVDGAIIDNVDIRSYGKCGISLAKATNVTITNTKIAAGGWEEDLGCMYSAIEGTIYNSPSSVTFGTGNELGNGFVKTERPESATGGTDTITGLESDPLWSKKVNDNGSFGYIKAPSVATEDELLEAILDASAGDAIALSHDLTLSKTLTVDKAITISLEGNTITLAKNETDGQNRILLKAAATVMNGTITRAADNTVGPMVEITKAAVLSGLTIDGKNIAVTGANNPDEKSGNQFKESYNGYGVYINGNGAKIENCVIKNVNAASIDGKTNKASGAGIKAYSSSFTVTDTEISGCVACTGAALYSNAEGGGDIVINGESKFLNNHAISVGSTNAAGGACYFDKPHTVLIDSDVVMSGNSSEDSAGALYVSEAPYGVTIKGKFLNNSTVNDNGGALYLMTNSVDHAPMVIDGAYFEGNVSGCAGGAVYVNSQSAKINGQVTINNTTFKGNEAKGIPEEGTLKDGGGAAFYASRGYIIFNSGLVTGNVSSGYEGNTNNAIIASNAGKGKGSLADNNNGVIIINGGTIEGTMAVGTKAGADAKYKDAGTDYVGKIIDNR